MIAAPPASGKYTLVDQVRRRLPSLEIIERFDALPTPEQRAALARVERRAGERRAILLTSETRLDAPLNPWRLRGEVREFGLADLALAEPATPTDASRFSAATPMT